MAGYANLPPGFRFFPSDRELVVHFLRRKAAHQPCQPDIIPTVDLHRCDPWDLTGKALEEDGQWYFFTLGTEHMHSPNGYWEADGSEEPVTSCGGERVGTKRVLGFYVGEAGNGIRTNWVMHEYRLLDAIAVTRISSKKRGRSRTTLGPAKKVKLVIGCVHSVLGGVHVNDLSFENNKWVVCRVYETDACGSQDGGGRELSCLDEVFLSTLDDDFDEVLSLPF